MTHDSRGEPGQPLDGFRINAPRCTWLQRLIDHEIDTRRVADYVVIRSIEVEQLIRSHHREEGYDPYNSASRVLEAAEHLRPLIPTWLKGGA